MTSLNNRKELNGKLGFFWYTQGFGKSYSMVLFARKGYKKSLYCTPLVEPSFQCRRRGKVRKSLLIFEKMLLNCFAKSNVIVFRGANMIITVSMLKEKYRDYANTLDKIQEMQLTL